MNAAYDMFISYARSERNRAEPIKDLFERDGYKVFFDLHGIDAGDEFPDVIDRALKQAGVVIGIWSSYALTRPWVRRECRVANYRGVLVPLALESIDPLSIPTEFFGVDYVQLAPDEVNESSVAWQKLLRAVRARLGSANQLAMGATLPRAHLLKYPRIYVADCGIPSAILHDVRDRLLAAGFDVPETKYSGYWVDVATQYYRDIDIAVIGLVDSDAKCNALHRLASRANSSAKKRSRFKSPASTGL